ncbi:MAG: class I SAM-dependent methyltransferase [Candidatus Diapherotrites archaeon]|jgi:2-polyprenyl-3-methyl-5-hydroxy-6-metoxy-1,4-benzoquinol methylase|nr:class I SAM-dependent methyltransferase [Candidatus Diapherotrites archaeon]MBT4597315.1 class I SAM-dependent methyltransferase [Candidatus Diapherotrites archaeon]
MKDYKNIKGEYYENAHGKDAHKSQSFMYNSREDYFIDFMKLKGNEKILDIGCGSGTFTRKIAKQFPKVEITGMDISEKVISFAKKESTKKKLKNTKFVISGINKIKTTGQFEVIIISHLIEHLEDPLDALREVKKKLAKNGRLFITTPNYSSLWPLAEKVFDKTIAKDGYSLDDQHISRFNTRSIKKIVNKAGLQTTNLKTLYVFSLEASIISKTLGNLFFGLDKALDFIPIGMIIYLEARIK